MKYGILSAFINFFKKSRPLRLFLLTFALMFGSNYIVHAEGSRELTEDPPGDGNRVYTEWDNTLSAGIVRQTLIKVYVQAGEWVNLGSSVPVSFSDPDDIIYRSPLGGDDGTCDVVDGGFGHIVDPAMEQAGPLTLNNAAGYIPCQFQATETGIYEVEFHAPLAASVGNPPLIGSQDPFPTDGTTIATVAAWDVTVLTDPADIGTEITGRAFTNLLALNVSNLNGRINSTVYVLSQDGYQYRVFLNGIQPFGFLLFSNSKGPVDAATNSPLYRSIQLQGGNNVQALPDGTNPPGTIDVDILSPNAPNNAATNDFTHKLFFNIPAADLPTPPDLGTEFVFVPSPSGNIEFRTEPIPPPTATMFRFEGAEADTPGQMGTNPLGGFFRYDLTRATSFQIIVDIDRDGTYGNNNDRVLDGSGVVGFNEVFWDGLDQNGVAVPPSNLTYEAELRTRAGEVHFPISDPENNRRGFEIERLNDPGTTVDPGSPFLIYYNDELQYDGNPGNYNHSLCADVPTSGDAPAPPDVGATVGPCYGFPPAPRNASVAGVNSAGGAHQWRTINGGSFGDERVMNTWTFYPGDVQTLTGGILISLVDLVMLKEVTPAQYTPGGPVTFTLTVTNNGPSDATGATVIDTFNAAFTNVTWSCVATGTAACVSGGAANATGTGDLNETVDIAAGAGNQLVYTIDTIIAPGTTGPLVNTAQVVKPPDTSETNLTNNESSVTINTAPSPTMTVMKDDGVMFVSANGQEVTYTITYENTSTVDAANVTLSDDLPAGATFVSCSDGCAGTGPVTWNIGDVAAGGTGFVTLTVDLPAAPVGTQHINTVTLSYTDTVGNPQPDETDNDIDEVVDANAPTMTVTKDDGVTVVSNAGEQVTYTITYTNTSAFDALNVVLSDVLPAGATFVSCGNAVPGDIACTGTGPVVWNLGTVPAGDGGSATLTVDLPAAPAGTLHENVVDLTYEDSVGNTYTATDNDIDEVVDPATMTPQMTISKDDGVVEVSPDGEQVTYVIVYENVGMADAVNVIITDTLPTGATFAACSRNCTVAGDTITWDIGTVPTGVSGSVSLAVNLPAVTPPAEHENIVQIDYEDTNGTVYPPETDNDIDIVRNNDPNQTSMTVSKDDGFIFVSSDGQQVTYTIVYENTSTVDAVAVTLTDNLPTGATFVSCSDACTGTGPVVWDIGNVAAGATGQVTLTVDLPPLLPPEEHINTVVLSYTDSTGADYPDEIANDIDQVTTQTLTPTVTGTPPTATPTVTGTPPTATPTVTGTPPTATPTVTGTPPTSTPIGTPPDFPPVTVTSIPVGDDPDPQLSVVRKQVSPPFVDANDTVEWVITVNNTSDDPVKSITIEDVLPPGLEIVDATTSDGKLIIIGDTVIVEIPILGPGETIIITITTQVVEGADAVIINTVQFFRPPNVLDEASATLVVADELPRTGETPWWVLPLRVTILVSVSGMVLFIMSGWMRHRQQR